MSGENFHSNLTISKYNFYVDRKDGCVGYNARTGVFALLSDEVASALRKNSLPEGGDTVEQLLELGFLARDPEIEQIIARYRAGMAQADTLSLTLVPTLSCNKACRYCFQDEYRNQHVMSEAIQRAILEYVEAKIAHGVKKITCTWYGGEPLLAKDIVIKVSRGLREICSSSGAEMAPMNIVTNGVLLSRETSIALADVGISKAQISFDALIDRGNTTRGVINEDGTPSAILSNVLDSKDHIDLSIRVNISKSNSDDASTIMSILEKYGLRGKAYIARISDLEGEAGCKVDVFGRRTPDKDAREDDDSLKRKKFAEFEERVLAGDPQAISVIGKRLTPKTHFCSATTGSGIVVDPSGDVSRCWLSAGSKSESIGNILDLVEDSSDPKVDDARWLLAAPFQYRECLSCHVLPLCMGGCSHSRVFMNAKAPPCETIKYQIGYFVQTVGERLAV